MANECTYWHKFEARYDSHPPESMTDVKISMTTGRLKDFIDALTVKIYVKDVCVYCGKEVKR